VQEFHREEYFSQIAQMNTDKGSRFKGEIENNYQVTEKVV
jgi:hypothetical protein